MEYGIQNEDSDIRAHVCPVAGRVYVYPTSRGLEAINRGKYRSVNGYQPGVDFATSMGFLVPPDDIRGCVPVSAERFILEQGFKQDDSTTVKGNKAVGVVTRLLRMGWFPLPVDPRIVDDISLQVSGLDLIVDARYRIQVKCDFRGGSKRHSPTVTGNLFLQVAECNPLGMT